MQIEEFWEAYTSSEKELFQRSCRRLLKHTFIVRDKDEENKKAYYFISKRPEPFSAYFRYIGFDIVVDRENGVVMLRNCADAGESGKVQVNRLQLKKAESVVLCCLWTLYADRIRSGSLSRAILVSITEIQFELEKYGVKDQIDKSAMTGILTLFSRFNLIEVNGKIGEKDCLVRLYPSLQFALESEEFGRFAELTRKRMLEKTGEVPGAEKQFWMMMGDFNARSSRDNWFYKYPAGDTRFLVHDYILRHTPYVDVIAGKYPGEFKTTTGGKSRIDFVYCTPPLYERITHADVVTDAYTEPVRDPAKLSNFWHPSDHRPIVVDFNMK